MENAVQVAKHEIFNMSNHTPIAPMLIAQDFSECANTIPLEGLTATDYPLMAEHFRKAAEKANEENKITHERIFRLPHDAAE